ncbi:MAG TPA: Asp-tRNA(Asn)/Glu-tRNA(Gln) amidotransferase subunit GatA [Rhizomicrobium sp.]
MQNKQSGFISGTLSSWCGADKIAGAAKSILQEAEESIDRHVDLNVFITTCKESAQAQAKASDEIIRGGRCRDLEGAPIAVKDNYCTLGIRTTAASRILTNFIPPYESFVTSRLLDAGAIVLGKTNMDEFAMGSSTENSAFGPTLNPRGIALGRDDIVPGGSSGGSAAAVAANMCLAAIGTDTGGSIRQPASFCGVVGFKPTYGACSRWGVIAYASSLDQPGVIAKTVEDAAIISDVICGHDARDSTSLETTFSKLTDCLRTDTGSPTIGIPKQFRDLTISNDLERLWQEIESRVRKIGAKLVYVDLPHIKRSLPAYYIIALSEASSNLARYDGVRYGFRAAKVTGVDDMYERTRGDGFGEEVKRRILLGTFALSSGYYDQYFLRAAKVRRLVATELGSAFEQVDVLAFPTAPTPAFKIGAHRSDPTSMYLEDVFTVPVNLAGLPAISIPGIVASNGLPMGLQIVGRRFADPHVLSIAHKMEQALDA